MSRAETATVNFMVQEVFLLLKKGFMSDGAKALHVTRL
jgi:hypothetical protein